MLFKEICCQELKAEMERYKENKAKKSSLLASLRDRVQELEKESAALSTSKTKAETARAAIGETRELTRRVAELDEKLRRGQIVTLEETINVHEMEAKAKRDHREAGGRRGQAAAEGVLGAAERDRLCQMVSQLEAQISELVEQVGKESESHHQALQQAYEAESKLEALQHQLTHLQGELVSGDVLRDSLNLKRRKYLELLEELSKKMKLDQMVAELGFDMCLDVVLARAEQLVRLESSAVIENRTVAHNLQRKLKTQKERLESKELHMNLLQQKVAWLEKEAQACTAVAAERDEAHLAVRKLEKKVERMQKELSMCRESNTELKAKLADTAELKMKTMEQTKAIEDLHQSRVRLDKMKEEAEKKLTSVRLELETAEREAREEKEATRSLLGAVTSGMETLRKSLEDAQRRETQYKFGKECGQWAAAIYGALLAQDAQLWGQCPVKAKETEMRELAAKR